jgi:dihydropteroate synthase
MIWKLPTRDIRFPRRPLVMGIVNVNDDSFSGDGTLDPVAALDLAREHLAEGADIIDVGAESARTNREAISIDEEIHRFRCFLEGWSGMIREAKPRDAGQVWPPVLSANTWRPEVVSAVLPLGVELINDMGGLPDPRNAESCKRFGASLLIMHTVGPPKVAQLDRQWPDVMDALERFFTDRIELAQSAGLSTDRLVLDPGIDFAKQRDDNLRIYQSLERLNRFGCPLMVPVSRKTVIGEVLGLEDPRDRDAGTVACLALAMALGGAIFRVHHVAAAWQSVKVLDAVCRV